MDIREQAGVMISFRRTTAHPGGRVSERNVWVVWLAIAMMMLAPVASPAEGTAFRRETSSIHVAFDDQKPGLSALSIDSLKEGVFRESPILDPGASAIQYAVSENNGWIQYSLSSNPKQTVWEMRCDGDVLRMRSIYRSSGGSRDMTWRFNPDVTHATLLGHVTSGGDIALPAVLHLPGMGSLRIFAQGNDSAILHYDARRAPVAFVSVVFPAATQDHPVLEYTLETAAIFRAIPGIAADDPKYDGFRRDFLDIFQQQAELHVLANHAGSDACAFSVYEYADMARYTPELVKGSTALDLVRETLDRYLNGFLAYGMPGYKSFDNPGDPGTGHPYVFSDTYPSLLISAFDYATGSGDERWLRHNYKSLRKWADTMAAANQDGSPLLETPIGGNSGTGTSNSGTGTSNFGPEAATQWWDDIGFGHQDAYANALGYRALRGMALLAERIGETADAARYSRRAQQIHDAYAAAFLDRDAGVLAGWRSQDGQLHNYYFPYVNGIAVLYGLVEGDEARKIMDRIMVKMDSVGFHNLGLGLPGNLIPIRRADYLEPDLRYGGPQREDGSDGFQIYQNGGATASFSYFTMAALYKLGEKQKADKILMPMLDSFARQGFSGRAPDGLTYDIKDWNGGARGYEGFLVDNYYALLAVLDRAKLTKMP